MTTLLIARHGNTFEDKETPRRIGAHTDMALTEKGRLQARAIGRYLEESETLPAAVFSGNLQRSRDTAILALVEARHMLDVHTEDMFNEIDHGPDENKTDSEVVARIGAHALKDWEEKAVVPPGWQVDPQALIKSWQDFAARMIEQHHGQRVLIVTSNGTARFAPYLTGDFDGFRKTHALKMATGTLSRMDYDGKNWRVISWGVKPAV
jgi:2,3-bisphosphoglycerate-dependent phosphoglycerate mutase